MQIQIVITVVILVLNLFLGFLVLMNDFKKTTNKYFFLLVLFLDFWIVCNFWADQVKNQNIAGLLTRSDFATGLITAAFFCLFSFHFPQPDKNVKKWFQWTILIPVFVLSILSYTRLIIDIKFYPGGVSYNPKTLFYLYVLLLIFFLFISLYNFLKNYKKTVGIERARLIYLLVGLIITFLIALITNLVIPNFVNKDNITFTIFSRIGIFGTIFFIVFTTYGIVKKQLFDIRVILTETATAIVVLALFIQTLLSKSLSMGVINGGILILISYGGYLLIKSVQEEIRRREELKRLSDQLAHANAHLKELDAMKTEFVSLASHELLTPVSAIEGYLSMLLDEKMAKVEDPKAQKYMDRVYSSAKRLARLVTDMLNVSRIEEGRLLVEKKEVNLADLIEQVIDELKFKADEKKQRIVFSGQVSGVSELKPKTSNLKPEFMTFGDPDKLKEVLVNLIGNAIKYSKDPGTITVRIEKVPTQVVAEKWKQVEDEIKGRPLDDQEAIKSAVDPHLKDLVGSQQILISVQDQGIGIPREELPRLFKKFHRVGDYTIAESQGTGLGLYISRALVELHHGRIWADSEGPGRGSTFTFSLPDISAKDEILKMEAQAPKPKEQLKPLARPVKEAEEL